MLLTVNNYRLSEVFATFATAVARECGDGIGWLVCEDPDAMSQLFEAWCGRTPKFKWILDREKDVSPGYVNFHDSNENFIFSSKKLTAEEADREFVDCLIYLEGDPKPE